MLQELEQRALLVLADCSRRRDLEGGKAVHGEALRRGVSESRFVLSGLINLYAKCGSMIGARQVFDGLVRPDIVDWNCLIQGYVEGDETEIALRVYQMVDLRDSRTYVAVLGACARLETARGIHSEAVKKRCCNSFVECKLVHTYGRLRSLEEARAVFGGMSRRNVVSWTALLQAYVENGEYLAALEFFDRIECRPNSRTYVGALMACAGLARGEEVESEKGKWLRKGEAFYREAVRGRCLDLFLQCTMIDLYGKCGSMVQARGLFEKMSRRNVVAWNALLRGYVGNGESFLALEMFEEMDVEGDAQTYAAAMASCAALAAAEEGDERKRIWLEKGRSLYSRAVSSRCCAELVKNVCVDMFAKCGSMVDAQDVFDTLAQGNVVAWTSLLQGYVENGRSEQALRLFFRGLGEGYVPNERTYVAALTGCATLASKGPRWIWTGKIIHALAVVSGCCESLFVSNKLIFMYSQLGSMVDARLVFDSMTDPNVVSWNCLAQGYVVNGESEAALKLVERTQKGKNLATFLAALLACKNLVAREDGERFHRQVKEAGLDQEPMVAAALVDFYGSCGDMRAAREVFDSIAVKTVEAWNALIGGFCRQGDACEALRVYERMDVRPSEITLTHLLAACSRAGLVDEARHYFDDLEQKFGVVPNEIHYNCMVDLLSRANYVDEAVEMLKRFKPNAVTWTTLLSAGWRPGNADVGRVAYEALVACGCTSDTFAQVTKCH